MTQRTSTGQHTTVLKKDTAVILPCFASEDVLNLVNFIGFTAGDDNFFKIFLLILSALQLKRFFEWYHYFLIGILKVCSVFTWIKSIIWHFPKKF